MATFYWNGAAGGDLDWQDLGNWWMNAAHTTPATVLPGPGDDVVTSGDSVNTNSGSAPTIRNISVYVNCSIDFTVTGLATFYAGTGVASETTLTGNALFTDQSGNGGTVDGNATFDGGDLTVNVGTVTLDATFLNDSENEGFVLGNATFAGTSLNSGSVAGDATFSDYAEHPGVVQGNATFYDSANSVGGEIGGDARYLGGQSYALGTLIDGTAFFSVGAATYHMTINAYFYSGGGITIEYDKGVNGSSILGIV